MSRKTNLKGLLFAASASGNVSLLTDLLAEGVDVNATNGFGETPLTAAVGARKLECARVLLQRGAHASHADRSGATVLMRAAEVRSNTSIIKLLLNAGSDVNAHDELNRTAIMLATATGAISNVRLLLKSGASISNVTVDDETALTFAIVWNRYEIASMLIAAGVDLNRRDGFGWRPLDYARQEGDQRILDLLERSGAVAGRTRKSLGPGKGTRKRG